VQLKPMVMASEPKKTKSAGNIARHPLLAHAREVAATARYLTCHAEGMADR
jgi:hypothetical protein